MLPYVHGLEKACARTPTDSNIKALQKNADPHPSISGTGRNNRVPIDMSVFAVCAFKSALKGKKVAFWAKGWGKGKWLI